MNMRVPPKVSHHRVPNSVVHAASTPESHCDVKLESVLRIRPLLKKERDDAVLLEPQKVVMRNAPDVAILNPLHLHLTSPLTSSGSLRARLDSTDSTTQNVATEYHFNHVLPESTSQDKIYYTLGLPIVTATMASLKTVESGGSSSSAKAPKSHLLICMGVANSGKTFTCLGGATIPKRRASQDGLIPRLLDSLFSQSKHHANGSSKVFGVQISMVQVLQPKGGNDSNASQIHDLLAPPSASCASKNKLFGSSPTRVNNLTVRNMAARFEKAVQSPLARQDTKVSSSEDGTAELDAENLRPTIQTCKDVTHAREVLQNGLNASQKITKGNQNFHLYITMQPVVDGVKFGDKISILDMAGLEREKRGQSSRGKDSVASMNQAASAAVLNCLRTMLHNVNIRTGNSNTLDVASADDEVSEISFVSQQKDPTKSQLKSVPFRQHKVTMLLNPLFATSASVKVTLVLAAYPGHVDLPQKRMLLQDIELLHGSTLALASNNAAAETGLTRLGSLSASSSSSDDQDESNGRFRDGKVPNDMCGIHRIDSKDSAARSLYLTSSSSSSYQESVNTDSHSPQREPHSVSCIPGRSKNIRTERPAATNILTVVEPNTARILRNVARKAPRVEPEVGNNSHRVRSTMDRVVKKKNEPTMELRVTPSAPNFCDIHTSHDIPPNRHVVSDFPGVSLPLPLDDAYSLSPNNAFPSYSNSRRMNHDDRMIPAIEDQYERGAKQVNSTQTKYISESKELLKSPLGGSSLENAGPPIYLEKTLARGSPHKVKNHGAAYSTSTEKVPHEDKLFVKSDDSIRTTFHNRIEDHDAHMSPSMLLVEPHSPPHQDKGQIAKLESKLKQTMQEKKALEQICSQLERENAHLKKGARDTGRMLTQMQWTDQDEKEFQASRRLRLESQNLIKAPVRSHMESVNYIYEIKNQWSMTNKPHFSLRFPNHFQRATVLDVRDKEKEQTKMTKNDVSPTKPDLESDPTQSTMITGKKLTYGNPRMSLTPPKISAPPLEPRGLAALKRVVGTKHL